MTEKRDAELILRFYELRREVRMREARSFMLGRFKARDLEELEQSCPVGSEENASFRQVLSYWDMVSSIVKRDLVDKELFFETNGELTVVWEKIRHLVPGLREQYGSPLFLGSLEVVAKEREAYLEKNAPGYLDKLRERLRAG